MVKIISFLSLMLLSISAYSNIGDIVIDGSIANANSDKGYVITEKQFDSFPTGYHRNDNTLDANR